MSSHRICLALAVLFAASAPLAAEPEWETVATGDLSIKVRAKENSETKIIWAEGFIAAPVQDVQSAVMDPESFPEWMPYVKESRYVGPATSNGSRFVYTRLDFPIVASRDYVLKVHLDKSVAPDGSGEFQNSWSAVTDKLPERKNVVRLQTNEGSWYVVPRGEGKSWAVYKFSVDPGGWIPSFAADMGNKTGVTDTFKAVEREAMRRAAARRLKVKVAKP